MADSKEVLVPDVGGEEVEVIEIIVSKGDSVDAEDGLITVESDKASMDIPAPFAGKVSEIKVSVGDKISEGDLIAMIEAGESSTTIPTMTVMILDLRRLTPMRRNPPMTATTM